ncbi:class I SAM-dependent DNA methyltransferase [Pararhizobium antarcticum]|uniref:Methyltransferase n=1 Tax=Pararhizobium antarcticum TaxID=1798805 RepID=A0A657LYW9_9HYPH|nr:methyltransferase domain-containing protein [Pararhizobium antarcticum]OJF98498.1 methyltransferase [Rhizobium sp. 58]OJG00970.1 methyltransferase [Pararhizobium antarcticum]
MNPHQLSSGDLIADRRAEYALMLAETGEHAAAADLMLQALELVPDWAAGWFRLADYQETSGEKAAAIEALRKVVALQPDDMFGAGLKLSLLGDAEQPAQPPSLYVERLFDDYADRFDKALVERLDYSVPQKLAALIHVHGGADRFRHVVDLGCGTGLFGAEIRDRAASIEGFDLSTNMLAKAADKVIYSRLAQADLSLAPEACGVFSADADADHRADLVSAADVLMYLGALDGVFVIASRLLITSGLFAFSVEDAGEDGDVVLRPSLRYAHSEGYISRLCGSHGFDIHAVSRTVIRKDGGKPVSGILFVTRNTG